MNNENHTPKIEIRFFHLVFKMLDEAIKHIDLSDKKSRYGLLSLLKIRVYFFLGDLDKKLKAVEIENLKEREKAELRQMLNKEGR